MDTGTDHEAMLGECNRVLRACCGDGGVGDEERWRSVEKLGCCSVCDMTAFPPTRHTTVVWMCKAADHHNRKKKPPIMHLPVPDRAISYARR